MKSKKNKNNVKLSNEVYEKIFQHAPNGIHLIDLSDYTTKLINDYLCKKLGYSEEELLDLEIWRIFLEKDQPFIKEEMEKFEQKKDYNFCNIDLLCKNNKIIKTDISPSFVMLDNEKYLLLVYRDIKERGECEENLRDLVVEKETFVREMNHRIKNNLQIISSLLSIHLIGNDNCTIKGILCEIDNKIKSISLLHDHVIMDNIENRIDVRNYVNDMIQYVSENELCSINKIPIEYNVDVDEIYMKMNFLLPIALIINELIIKAKKHSFKDMDSGNIDISLKKNNNQLILTVSDNGRGLSDMILNQEIKYQGSMILNGLLQQLDATMDVDLGPGTKYKIIFNF